MGITLRNSKGSPLTHNELDANFQELYYSASYTDYHLSLFQSKSLEGVTTIPINQARGPVNSIQIKTDHPSGSATGSSHFTYDYSNDILRVTGSTVLSGSGTVFEVKGNGDITGNLTVGGTVTAEEFITERVATSYIYKSGSTKFGDTSDDRHDFTGSLGLQGSATLTGDLAISGHSNVSASISTQSQRLDTLENKTLVSSSAQIADDISGSLSNSAISALGAGILSSSLGIANLGAGIISSSTQIAADISGSYVLTNAKVQELGAGIISASSQIADLGVNIPSSSAQVVTLIDGQDVNLGRVTSTEMVTNIISSSVQLASGSNIFGDAAGDRHEFTGSVHMSSTLAIEGFPNVSQSLAAAVAATGADWNVNLQNIPADLVSSSAQLAADISGSFTAGTALDLSGGAFSVDLTELTTIPAVMTSADSFIVLDGGTTQGKMGPASIKLSLFDNDANFIDRVSDDNAPRLGGDLDVSGSSISGSGTIDLDGDISGSGLLIDGDIDATGDITAYHSSDRRLKDNLTVIQSPIDKISQISGYEFDWNSNSNHEGHDIGVVAQEIEAVLPEVVATRDNGYKAVRYEKIVALLIEAIKDQQAQIDDLKSKL